MSATNPAARAPATASWTSSSVSIRITGAERQPATAPSSSQLTLIAGGGNPSSTSRTSVFVARSSDAA